MDLVINPHLTTTNVVVQRQIVRDNISRINNFKASDEFKKMFYPLRKNVEKALSTQKSYLNDLNKKLKENSQFDLPIEFNGQRK